MNASSLYSMRIIGEQTSPLADAVQCSKSWGSRHRGVCSANTMMLPGFRIVDVQSNVENLVLESFLAVSDMSGPAQILGSRSRGALAMSCCC